MRRLHFGIHTNNGVYSALVLLLLVGGPASATSWGPPPDERALRLDTFDQVWTTIRERHYDPTLGGVDWDAVRDEFRPRAGGAASKAELRGILMQTLARLGQSHLAILPGEALSLAPGGEASPSPADQVWDTGCGFEVRVAKGHAEVVSVRRSSAADTAGVKEGWLVLRIAGRDVPDPCEYTGDVSAPLLMAEGDRVTVGFVTPDGEGRDVTLPLTQRRSRLYEFAGMPPMEVWFEHRWLDDDVGYIAFNWFFDPLLVMSRFLQAMATFADAAAVVVDIRGNHGGSGAMAAAMIASFAAGEAREVGTIQTRACDIVLTAPQRPVTFAGRVAVLIDGQAASAAEIFAAGMRDVAGARLVGAPTMGAVLPAGFERLPSGDFLQFIVARYVTVHGQQLEGSGVTPDQVASPLKRAELSEDAAIMAALEWVAGGDERSSSRDLDRSQAR